jgi:simple sugar transport system ATP-binding protein
VDVLARLMVGGEVPEVTVRPPRARGALALRAADVTVASAARSVEVHGATLEVHAGEILGVAGVDGNGQPELMDAIAGLRAVSGGRIELLGEDVTGWDVDALARHGLAHIPEDRRAEGLALPMSVAWNIGIRHFQQAGTSRWAVDYRALRRLAAELIEDFDVRGATPDTAVGDLSGGNQQKVLLARELSTEPKVLLASNPTAGLDVGAAAFVHEQVLAARDRGCAIVLVAPDLDELMLLSDRIVVMYGGRTVGEVMERPFSRQRLGLLMGGVGREGPAAVELAG